MAPKKPIDADELMIVNDSPGEECRIAILKDRHLEELYTERTATATNVGNIYKGRVVNVESAIQAAFVDFGEGANGFLHISDLHPKHFPGQERTERVQKVSIIPRGVAALGYTMQLPLEDRYLMTLPELREKIAALLGGRAAEELFMGEVSTGASNDLQQATDIARAMVRDYGMSDELGPVSLSDGNRALFLQGQVAPESRALSEHVRRLVDAEVQRIVEEGLERARMLVRQHREKLESIAARLTPRGVWDVKRSRVLLPSRPRTANAAARNERA